MTIGELRDPAGIPPSELDSLLARFCLGKLQSYNGQGADHNTYILLVVKVSQSLLLTYHVNHVRGLGLPTSKYDLLGLIF